MGREIVSQVLMSDNQSGQQEQMVFEEEQTTMKQARFGLSLTSDDASRSECVWWIRFLFGA